MVDGDAPCIGKVYVHMFLLGEGIKKSENLTSAQKRELLDVHLWRWEMMSSDIQKAAYVLDPEYMLHDVMSIKEVMDAFWRVAAKLLTEEEADKVAIDLPNIRLQVGSVGSERAQRLAPQMEAAKWWASFGADYKEAQKMAMLVLAQVASSSSCERNWSRYGFIHNALRNRLSVDRARKLVYCFAKERLLRKKQEGHNVIAWRDSDTEED